jgi:hypothetical protein
MRDPQPENIAGEKVQRHVFKHEVNWGYVALALVGLLVVLKLSSAIANSDDEDEDEKSSVL